MNYQTSHHRLIFLDTLRGLAAISVVLFHLNEPDKALWPGVYKTIVSYGWLGVIAFFVISGFSIVKSALQASSITDYARRRFWRIYPPFFASLMLVAVFVMLRKLSFGTNDFTPLPNSLPALIATVTLTTDPVSRHSTVNWVYWTLSYEIAFYLVIGVTVASRKLLWPALIVTTTAAVASGQFGDRTVFFLDNWSFFATGAALALWRERGGFKPWLLMSLCLLDYGLNQSLAKSVTGLVTVGLCAACLTNRAAWLNRDKFVSSIGEWSYGLYLIHVPIGCWFLLRVFGPVRSHSSGAMVAGDFVILLLCVGAAWLFFRWIEQPAMAVGRDSRSKAPASDYPAEDKAASRHNSS